MDNGGRNGRDCFEVEVRTDATKLTNVITAGLRESSDLIKNGKVCVKDEAKISSRVGGAESGVVCFGQLLTRILRVGIEYWRS